MSDENATDPTHDLRSILNHYAPESLVYAGETVASLVADWQSEHPDAEVLPLPKAEPQNAFPLPRLYDLALISDTLENLSANEGRLLLGQLRNSGASRLAVLVSEDAEWSFRDFIGLGFKRLHSYRNDAGQQLFAYDIASYNHKRDWNNPENWANPEMWDKARW